VELPIHFASESDLPVCMLIGKVSGYVVDISKSGTL
jgi:hypothetical protein